MRNNGKWEMRNLFGDMLLAAILSNLCGVPGCGQTAVHTTTEVAPERQQMSPGYVHAQPLIVGQRILDISEGGIESRSMDGKVLWRVPVTKYLPTQLVALDDTVIVIEGEAYALNISDGSRRWTRKLDGNGALTQAIAYEGRVYLGTRNNLIYCLDGRTGAIRWKKDISEGSPYPGVVRAVTVSSASLVVATEKWGDQNGLSVSGSLYRLSMRSGGTLWKYDARAEKPSTARSGMSSVPVVGNGIVYVSDALGGSLRAISLSTGELVWKASVEKPGVGILVPPLILGKQVVFGGGDGIVKIVDAASGTATASRNLGSAIVDLRACGSDLVAATWGTALKLGSERLGSQRINDKLTISVTSKLADVPDHSSLIGFSGASLVTIDCVE